jgi:hypothetical protein
VGCFLVLLNPEYGGSMFLWNIRNYLLIYMASYPWKLKSS